MNELLDRLRTLHKATYVNVPKMLMRILEVVVEMLHDRGCTAVDAASTWDELQERILAGAPVALGGDAPRTRVLFHLEERVAIRAIRDLVESADEFDRTIVVSVEGPTSFARRELAQAEAQQRHFQFFRYAELCVNVSRHALVPRHERVADGTREFADAAYPKILQSDAVCRYYDFQPGELLRIERRFGGSDLTHYYRLVVAG